MITKKFGKDFDSGGGALTLRVSEVSAKETSGGPHTRKHKSGWKITGTIREDYYTWVNDFKASHPKLGRVYGNFEGKVYASNERAFKHFWKHHQPHAWDYQDI